MLIIAIAIRCAAKNSCCLGRIEWTKKKKFFKIKILRFRTLRTDTPYDAPTYELTDSTKWITKVGGLLWMSCRGSLIFLSVK